MIEIQKLCKSYGHKKVYEAFNLQIKKHQITGITGPSGCGKTTLLRLLAGLEAYETGSIEGLEKETVSMVFQEDCLMPWLSVEENIKYVLGNIKKEEKAKIVQTILSMLELAEERVAAVSNLSGGMKRRVAVARALAYKSSILLMDEPFKGLDAQLKKRLMSRLKSFWKARQMTVVIATHDLEMLKTFDDYITLQSNNPQAE